MVIDAYPAAVLGGSSPFINAVLGLLTGSEEGAVDDIVEELRDGTGIDLLSVEYVEMFMEIDALLETGLETLETEVGELTFGMALYGDVDEDEIIASFGRDDDVDYSVSDYSGFTVYLIDDVGGDPMTVGIVDEGTVVLGARASVQAMLDVAAGSGFAGIRRPAGGARPPRREACWCGDGSAAGLLRSVDNNW